MTRPHLDWNMLCGFIWNLQIILWRSFSRIIIISLLSDLTDEMKRSFFQATVVSILLYGCTTWTLTKRLEKKLDGNYTRMLRAILNKSWRQHPTRRQLYGHLPPITKTIQVRRARHAGHCWRSKDELVSDVLQWTPTYSQAKAGRPARTYIQQLCEDTGCNPEDLPEAMNDREKWREMVRDMCAGGTTWWWWWLLLSSSPWDFYYIIIISSSSIKLIWEFFPPALADGFPLESEWQQVSLWLIVSCLSPHYLHLLFCCVSSLLLL